MAYPLPAYASGMRGRRGGRRGVARPTEPIREGDAPGPRRGAWLPWGGRLSDLGYAAALYEAVFGPPEEPGGRGALGAQVHRMLWTRIVDRDLAPGGRLFEDDIAALARVSRLPVRDAVARLVEDGLLLRRGRGIQVRAFGPEDLDALYAYRALLEAHAAEIAARTVGAAQIEALRDDQRRLRAALDHPEPRYVVDFLVADLRLHDTVLAAAGNPYVRSALRRIRGQIGLFQADGLRREEDVRRALEEHCALLDGLAAGDGAAAAAAMRRHVLAAGARVRRPGSPPGPS